MASPYPVFHVGKFDVPHGADGSAFPSKEVFTPDEWVAEVRSIQAALREIQRAMELRKGDAALVRRNPAREDKACDNVRDAFNLLGMALVFVLEDGLAAGEEMSPLASRVFPAAAGRQPAAGYNSFEEMAAEELTKLVGLFGSRLRLHYLATHPELLPHRHWMVMQAAGEAFTKLLVAVGDMRFCAYPAA